MKELTADKTDGTPVAAGRSLLVLACDATLGNDGRGSDESGEEESDGNGELHGAGGGCFVGGLLGREKALIERRRKCWRFCWLL